MRRSLLTHTFCSHLGALLEQHTWGTIELRQDMLGEAIAKVCGPKFLAAHRDTIFDVISLQV